MEDEFDWVERLQSDSARAWLNRLVRERDARTVAEMEQRLDDDVPPAPGDVVLYGTEGQVDYVWSVPEPLPHTLYAAVPPKLRFVQPDEPVTADLRKAEYRRIGERTYQRSA